MKNVNQTHTGMHCIVEAVSATPLITVCGILGHRKH